MATKLNKTHTISMQIVCAFYLIFFFFWFKLKITHYLHDVGGVGGGLVWVV